MQLTIVVRMHGGVDLMSNDTITSFADLDKMANRIGRSIKEWARRVPLRRRTTRLSIEIGADWKESVAPPRKAKR